jgi:TonB family protein
MTKLAVATRALVLSAAACGAGPSEQPPAVVPAPPVVAMAAPVDAPLAPAASPLAPATAPSRVPPRGPCATISASECGKWEPVSLERWRDAMESYRSGVVVARELPLSPIGKPLAQYLNGVHGRVHPWFTDRFLVSLDKAPKDDPLSAPGLVATLELAIAPDGHIAQMGVVRSSGVVLFDASGLEAFARAAPFEPTPEQIRSADGNVWVQWQVHRDGVYGCSTMNARPFLLAPGR